MVNYFGPGPGALVAAGSAVIYLPTGARPDQLAALYDGLAQTTATLVSSLELLTAACGPALDALPPFAVFVVDPGPSVRLACRGETEVTVLDIHGAAQTITGRSASMWQEVVLADVAELSVGAQNPDNGGSSLPLRAGAIVGVAGFTWVPETDSLADAEPVAGHATEPAEHDDVLADLGATWQELPEEWFATDGAEETIEPLSREPYPQAAQAPAPATPPQSSAPLLPPTAVIAAPVVPYFGTVYLSTGEQLELGSPIVVGRRPTLEGAGAQPGTRLVTVPSPVQDISRNHLGVHMEGGYVLATDLGSVNGTILRRAGQNDRTMNPREGTLIYDGDVLDLGDGVTLNFRGLQGN